MNKIKTLVMGALIAVAGMNNAFAEADTPQLDAIQQYAAPEDAAKFANLTPAEVNARMEADPEYKALYERLVDEITQTIFFPKPIIGDGLDPNEPYTFDKAYKMYKSRIGANDIHYVVVHVQLDKLEEAATTPVQKEAFKSFKTQYEAFCDKAFEKNNTDFVAAAKKLLSRTNEYQTTDKSARVFANAGVALYHRYVAGDKKGKATKAQLKEVYTSLKSYIKDNPSYKIDPLEYTPDGKKVPYHSSYFVREHDVVRSDLGPSLGMLGSVSSNGKIYHEGTFVGQVALDGSIWTASNKEVGFIDKDGKIRINGAVKAEYKGGKCYIGGKYVGSVNDYSFTYANNKSIPLATSTNGIFDAFVLFFYKVIPQK